MYERTIEVEAGIIIREVAAEVLAFWSPFQKASTCFT